MHFFTELSSSHVEPLYGSSLRWVRRAMHNWRTAMSKRFFRSGVHIAFVYLLCFHTTRYEVDQKMFASYAER